MLNDTSTNSCCREQLRLAHRKKLERRDKNVQSAAAPKTARNTMKEHYNTTHCPLTVEKHAQIQQETILPNCSILPSGPLNYTLMTALLTTRSGTKTSKHIAPHVRPGKTQNWLSNNSHSLRLHSCPRHATAAHT